MLTEKSPPPIEILSAKILVGELVAVGLVELADLGASRDLAGEADRRAAQDE